MRQNGAARHCIAITDNTPSPLPTMAYSVFARREQKTQRSFGLRIVGRPLKTSDS
jgi:hypothetical protein